MIRRFGILGAVVVAALAMSAFVASAAQAIVIEANDKTYPETVTGVGTEIGEHFLTEAGKITCHESEYHGTLSEASSTLTVAPDYTQLDKNGKTNCTAFAGFANASIDTEGCTYVFHATSHDAGTATFTSSVDVVCPTGQSIKISAGTCKAEVKGQVSSEAHPTAINQGLTTVDVTDGASNIQVRPTVKGIAYTVTNDGFLCPFVGTGNKTGGEYTSTGYISIGGVSAVT